MYASLSAFRQCFGRVRAVYGGQPTACERETPELPCVWFFALESVREIVPEALAPLVRDDVGGDVSEIPVPT